MKKQKYLFRAKYIDSDQWVYGGGVWKFDHACLLLGDDHNGEIIIKSVKEKTVGQFIGMKDARGEDLFEGDILRPEPLAAIYKQNSIIEKQSMAFVFRGLKPFANGRVEFSIDTITNPQMKKVPDMVKIGNSVDNPELLKELP